MGGERALSAIYQQQVFFRQNHSAAMAMAVPFLQIMMNGRRLSEATQYMGKQEMINIIMFDWD